MANTVFAHFAARATWMLVHSLWQLALIGAVTVVLLRMLAAFAPQSRYAVALCGLLAMAASAAFTALAPPVVSDAVGAGFTMVGPPAGENVGIADATEQAAKPAVEAEDGLVAQFIGAVDQWIKTAASWHMLATVWFCSAAVLAVWNVGGLFSAWSLASSAVPADSQLQSQLDGMALQQGIRRHVELREAARVEGPVVLGWRRPVLLMPADLAERISSTQLRAVFSHELVHVRRSDYLVNLLQVAIESLLLHHPAVWWLSRRIRIEREYCCDDAASAACGGRIIYAEALSTLAGHRGPAFGLAVTGGSETMIVHRVRRILQRPEGSESFTRTRAAAAVVLLMLTIATLAWAGPRRTDNTDSAAASADKTPVSESVSEPEAEDGEADSSGEPVRAVRQVFRPATRGSGRSSWSNLAESPFAGTPDQPRLMMMATAYRGDRWPVKIVGREETLFQVELIDGGPDKLELRLIEGDSKRPLIVKIDEAQTVTIGGRDFSISYGTTTVAGTETQYVDYAHLIITTPRKGGDLRDELSDFHRALRLPDFRC